MERQRGPPIDGENIFDDGINIKEKRGN